MSTTTFIKKTYVLASAGILLAACGNGEENGNQESAETETNQEADNGGEDQTITIGASTTPHAEILEFVAPTLEEEEGITLEIEEFTDYPLINQALDAGDLDANYFQHVPFLEQEIEENGYDIVSVGAIHIEPIGAYSLRHSSLDELPEGADILVSSNAPDYGRILEIFVDHGLIEVDESVELVDADFSDITENPLDLNFEFDYDPALMPTLLENDEGDVVFINSNFAVDHDLSPVDDAIAIQDVSEDSPYANLIVARSEDEDNEALATLVEYLQAEETQQFIEEEWGGSVVPVGGE